MKIPSSNLNEVGLLDRAVLVLNANYSPMMICTAKRAICLDYLDKIDILANYNEKVSFYDYIYIIYIIFNIIYTIIFIFYLLFIY